MARPTLVSLAKELGVSRQTVSNVINAPHLVKPETRERVQAAIDASGYRPNQAAQALRHQRSRTIAMRVYPTLDEGINGAVMDRFLHSLASALQACGYSLLLLTADSFEEEVATLREMAVRGRIDGCVLTSTHAGDRRPAALGGCCEVVAFGRPWGGERDARHVWVDVDGAHGTRQATRHLLRQGHRRVGFIGWPSGSEVGDDRLRGWREAMAEAGATDIEDWRAEGIDTMTTGLEAAERLLSRGIEAVVCASDSLAVGALEAIRRHSPVLDGQAPVTGFDDTPVARALGLSSVAQDVERAVAALCEQLVGTLEHRADPASPEPPTLDHLLQPRLVVRELGSMVAVEHDH